MNTVQLTIDMDVETKQRVEAAAAEEHLTVNDYVLTAVQRRLANNSLVSVRSAQTQEEFDQHMKNRDALRESILAERNGELIDVNAIIDLVRDERDAELYDLR